MRATFNLSRMRCRLSCIAHTRGALYNTALLSWHNGAWYANITPAILRVASRENAARGDAYCCG